MLQIIVVGAAGAIKAARWVVTQPKGLYDLSDILRASLPGDQIKLFSPKE